MNRVAAWICIGLGAIAVPATGYWCLIALAFGTEFKRATGIFTTLALLLMGPLSLLPAGIVGLKRPRFAGCWLMASALASFLWYLGVVCDEGFSQLFRAHPTLEILLPVTVVYLPMALLGFALSLSAGPAPDTTKRRRIPLLAGITIAVTLLMLAASVAAEMQVRSDWTWTLTVRPMGKEPTTISFQIWTSEQDWERRVATAIAPLFAEPGTADRVALGSYELRGPGSEESTYSFALVLDRVHLPGFITIFRNGESMSGDPDPGKLNNASFSVIDGIRKIFQAHPAWR